jgi:hypothetical protein
MFEDKIPTLHVNAPFIVSVASNNLCVVERIDSFRDWYGLSSTRRDAGTFATG